MPKPTIGARFKRAGKLLAMAGRVVSSGYAASRTRQSLQDRGGRYFNSWERGPGLLFNDDSDVMESGLLSVVNSLVGPGIKPRLQTGSANLDERLGLLWRMWAKTASLDGQHFDDLARLLVRCWQRDGEAFLVLADALKVQLLESGDLPHGVNHHGIEVDQFGRPTAFRFMPGAGEGFAASGLETRVDAARVLHVKTVQRVRQLRGFSPWSVAYNRIDDLRQYDAAENGSAKIAAAMAVMIRKDGQAGIPIEANPEGGDETGLPEWPEAGGMVFADLEPGESVEQIIANRPNPELTRFRQAQLRQIAATTGVDYTALSRDVPGSYSAARQLSVISSRDADALWSQLCRQAIEPLWAHLVGNWLRMGMVSIQPPMRAAALMPVWRRPQERWIDPSRQAKAWRDLNEIGAASSDEIRTELQLDR